MNEIFYTKENNLIEVFSGTAWEVALVQSLLENAEIKTYVYYGGGKEQWLLGIQVVVCQ